MALSIGIVGLPNVGKSTLFSALTKNEVLIANYPFATVDPNVGVVEVPDDRLEKLAVLSQSKRVVPTIIEFSDIAGLVKGANKGEGLGNQFLSHIREVDAIVYVVRAFEADDIQHVEHSVDPIRDIDIVRTELALKDVETIERRLHGAAKEAKRGDKDASREYDLLTEWKELLNGGAHLYENFHIAQPDVDAVRVLKNVQLLTAKPALYLVNTHNAEVDEALVAHIARFKAPHIAMDVREELEGTGLTSHERDELELGPSALPQLIGAAYRELNLITFFTTGTDETRAWTVGEGSAAPQAAGVIHTDFESGFIRAEVIQWEQLLKAGGWSQARASGVLRTEGKGYIIKDGDVLVILHSD